MPRRDSSYSATLLARCLPVGGGTGSRARSASSRRSPSPALGGASMATACGRCVHKSSVKARGPIRFHVSLTTMSSSSTTSSPLPTETSTPRTLMSPPRCPARRIPGSSLGAFAVSQELQQIGSGEDAQRLAVLRHDDCGSVLELGEGRLQRIVELDHGKGWGHDLGHVGLERVGVAEDAVEERSLPDRTNEGTDLERGLPDRGGLGDAESLKPIDGLADLLVGAHRDQRWDLAMLG